MQFHKSFVLLLALLFLCGASFAQGEMGLFFTPRAFQHTFVQPAHYPEAKFHFALPHVSLQMEHNGFRLSDMLSPIAGTDSFQVDVNRALERMPDNPYARVGGSVEPFLLGLRVAGLQFNLSARSRFDAAVGYSKDLLRLAWEGNSDRLGEQLDLAPDFSAQAFQEIGLGVAIPVGKKLRVGVRAKYLAGLANISVVNRQLDLITQPEYYQLELEADYQIRSSQLSLGSLGSGEPDPELLIQPFSSNWGLGLDMGVTYESDKWMLSASLIDYGFLAWRSNAREYRLQGELSFDGLDAFELMAADSVDFGAIADTFLNSFEFSEENIDSYTTFLPARIYLGASYSLPFKMRLGGATQLEVFRGRLNPAFMFSFNKDFGKILSLGVNYSSRKGQFDQVGANLLFKAGPVAWFISSDNLLPFFQPQRGRFTNLRMGMNLIFK